MASAVASRGNSSTVNGFRGIPPVYRPASFGRWSASPTPGCRRRTGSATGRRLGPALDRRARVKSPTRMSKKRGSRTARWLRLSVIGAGLTGFAVAYRFALIYRERAGLPHRSPVEASPADFGLAFEQVEIPAGDRHLVGWFVPAEPEGAPKKVRSGARTEAGDHRRAGRRNAARHGRGRATGAAAHDRGRPRLGVQSRPNVRPRALSPRRRLPLPRVRRPRPR